MVDSNEVLEAFKEKFSSLTKEEKIEYLIKYGFNFEDKNLDNLE